MASGDDGEDSYLRPGSLSMSRSSIKPKLDSIFAEVEKNLPSIDFEVSDVSSDEEFSIFQRCPSSGVPVLTDDEKDLDESLSDDHLIEPLDHGVVRGTSVSTGTSPRTPRFGGPLMHTWVKMETQPRPTSVDKGTEMTFNDTENSSVGVFTSTESSAQDVMETRDIGIGSSDCGSSASSANGDTEDVEDVNSNRSNHNKDKNRNRWDAGKPANGKTVVRSHNTEVTYGRFMPRETILSMASLDNINFDDLSSYVRREETSAYDAEPPSQSIYEAAGHVTESLAEGDQSLIAKLARLSMQTTGKDLSKVDPQTGAIPKNSRAIQDNQIKDKLKKKQRAATGVSTVDLPPIAEFAGGAGDTKQLRDTIFLDLRDNDKNGEQDRVNQEAVRRILNLNQYSDDDSSGNSDSDEEGLWFEKRRRIRQSIEKHGHVKVEDVEQKTRPYKPPIKDVKTRGLSEKKMTSTRSVGSSSVSKVESEGDRPTVVTDQPSEQSEQQEREKQRRLEAARKVKEQKEQVRQSRIRLSQRLDALRPKMTVKGKQSCAEETPVLFDLEASYEPAPSPLPPAMSLEQECCLLTIHLSSSGQILMHRQTSGKSLDSGMGFPGSYPTLLSWLLSHVPDDFSFLHQSSKDGTSTNPLPFYVVGLQQLWLDGQLMLIVAVVPTENFDAQAKVKKGKGRDAELTTPFQQMLCKYLSVNTLSSVCPWFSAFEPIKVTSNVVQVPVQSKADESFTYAAPLPSITAKPLSTFIQINPDKLAVSKMFGTNIGFFWQTVDSEETCHYSGLNDEQVNYDTQNTMSLVYRRIYQDPPALMGILSRVLQEGLDLAGIRLLYPTQALLNTSVPVLPTADSSCDLWNNIGPILALSVRGFQARTVWLDTVGPADPALARRTDPNSLSALFGGESKDNCLFFCPRTPLRTNVEICRWFGGRVPPSGVVDVGVAVPSKRIRRRSGSPSVKKSKKVSFLDDTQEEGLVRTDCPPATLTAMSRSDIFLTASPLLPAKAFGIVLAMCQRRGYQLRGMRRLRLTTRKATMLGISSDALPVFCPDSNQSSSVYDQHIVQSSQHPAHPATIFQLQKENAMHNTTSLIEAIMIQLCYKGILGEMGLKTHHPITSGIVFQASPFTDVTLNGLGGEFYKVPDLDVCPPPGYISPHFHTNPESEQIVVLAMSGHQLIKTCGLFLAKLLNLLPHGKTQPVAMSTDGFELLGIKWLPCLNTSQAKELTPYEVGDKLWKSSIHTLTSEPAVVLLLRGVNAFARVQSIINTKAFTADKNQKMRLEKLMSITPEAAYRLATLFFFDRELFSDPGSRPLLPYLPPCMPPEKTNLDSSCEKTKRSRNTKSSRVENSKETTTGESILASMVSGPQILNTVLVVKPSAVRKHFARILKRLISEGFVVVALTFKILSETEAMHLLSLENRKDEAFCHQHVTHMTSGDCLVLCVQRENAVKKLVDVVGPDNPVVARQQSQMFWRALYGNSLLQNGLYVSPDYASAVRDRKLFFPEGLCCAETPTSMAEEVTCPAVDSIINVKQYNRKQVELREVADGEADHLTALTQTNCILLTPPLLKPLGKTKRHGYLEVIEALVSHHFEIVGGRMVRLTEEQAEHYLHLCNAGSYKLVPTLLSGSSIVLAVQRDNAVMSFDTLLGGQFQADSVYSKYGDQILRPLTVKQANSHLAFFFDRLSPHAHAHIKI